MAKVSCSFLVVVLVVLLQCAKCQFILASPCGNAAYYDGTDIGRPVIVDNSTGVPQYEYIEVDGYHPPSNKSKRAATAHWYRLWPHGIVYYEFHRSISNLAEQEIIYDAMRHWEAETCIRFFKRPYGRPGMLFFRGPGCCSYVGMIGSYFIQPVSIGYGCGFRQVVHEIGHVLGFWHEQSRPDRDEFINVHLNNVRPGYTSNFNKQSTYSVNSLGVTYDFNSIMHYSEYAFSRVHGTKTLSSKEPGIPLGQSSGLSPLDIQQTQILYKEQCRFRGSSASRLPLKKSITPPSIVPPLNGKHLKAKSGQFSAPDYPQPYRSNTDNVWIIEVPEGNSIYIEVHNIRIESPCDVNHVAVYSGATDDRSTLLREVCGSWSRYRFSTWRNFAYIKFKTGPSANARRYTGFSKITFEAKDIDECRFSRCDHTCTNLEGSYKCTCRDGYYLDRDGRGCLDVNECGSNNGGCVHKCVNTAGSHRCECPNGLTGCYAKLSCSTSNGGCVHKCTDGTSGVVCSCNSGYELQSDKKSCRDINECTANRGICGTGGTCTNRAGSYTCQCSRGYWLRNRKCEDFNECSIPSRCGANSRCVNLPGSYRCDCNSGYTWRSGSCRVTGPSCSTNNGGCAHKCTTRTSGVVCSCNSGYELQSDRKSCHDINECTANRGICGTGGTCVNRAGSYTCQCSRGYWLRNRKCEDIDECIRPRCGANSRCVNLPGSYRCSCSSGYILRSGSCTDIDECSDKTRCSDPNKKCVNLPGTFNCQCKDGYKQLQNGNCEDIDECTAGPNVCIKNEKCTNKPGGYSCQCEQGYRRNDDRNCKDINECEEKNVCSDSCVNTPGSYRCECKKGHKLARDGRTCKDINECATGNHTCEQKCVNTEGSYSCECQSGYFLKDKRTCKDINECRIGNHTCEHKCVNTNGSYSCECQSGYVLRRDKYTCKDINECRISNHTCERKCINTDGSYYCECQSGFELRRDKRTCKDIDECKVPEHNNCSQICTNLPGSYQCECSKGFQLRRDKKGCKDINECANGLHDCEHICVNTPGSYKCVCRDGNEPGRNKSTCKDIDECLINNGGCDHICTNTKGSYRCSCNTSYVLAADNMKCNDVDSCTGFTTQEPRGSIATNGYPNSSYAPHSNCTWIIDLPVTYKSIKLKFDGLFIEESVDCVKDRVTIFNGISGDSLPLGSFCGSQLPATVHSSTGAVTVKLTSDDTNNKAGFRLHYTGLEERVAGLFDCDLVITKEGTFGPTTFPSKYIDPMVCKYRIVAPSKKQQVKLTFLYVDVQDSDCHIDSVAVYSGRKTTPEKRLTQFCGGSHGDTVVTSTGPRMTVIFTGRTSKRYQGFHASVQFV